MTVYIKQLFIVCILDIKNKSSVHKKTKSKLTCAVFLCRIIYFCVSWYYVYFVSFLMHLRKDCQEGDVFIERS